MNRLILVLVICLAAVFCKAQLPEKYIGNWNIVPQFATFTEYKNVFVNGMQEDPERWKIRLAEYKKDSTSFINKMHAEYDSTNKRVMVLNKEMNYVYKFYDSFYARWDSISGSYTYNPATKEITLEKSCYDWALKIKISDVSERPMVINLELIFSTDQLSYDTSIRCFPGTCLLRKIE